MKLGASDREESYRSAIRQALGALDAMRIAGAEADRATEALLAVLRLQGHACDGPGFHERETMPEIDAEALADTDRPVMPWMAVAGCDEEDGIEESTYDVLQFASCV